MEKSGVNVTEECVPLCDTTSAITPCGSLRSFDDEHKCSTLHSAAFIKAAIGSKAGAGQITLKFPSVGATENLLLCFAMLNYKIQINNAAREPEIIALQQYLNQIGANISGAGSSRITISPAGTYLNNKPTIYTTPHDRIESGTYLIAGAICGGELYFSENTLISQSGLLNILKPSIKEIMIMQ